MTNIWRPTKTNEGIKFPNWNWDILKVFGGGGELVRYTTVYTAPACKLRHIWWVKQKIGGNEQVPPACIESATSSHYSPCWDWKNWWFLNFSLLFTCPIFVCLGRAGYLFPIVQTVPNLSQAKLPSYTNHFTARHTDNIITRFSTQIANQWIFG